MTTRKITTEAELAAYRQEKHDEIAVKNPNRDFVVLINPRKGGKGVDLLLLPLDDKGELAA